MRGNLGTRQDQDQSGQGPDLTVEPWLSHPCGREGAAVQLQGPALTLEASAKAPVILL